MISFDEMLEDIDALKADINRMRDTDNLNEFLMVSKIAKYRLEDLCEYHYARLTEVK